jgi:hypothetical protein
MEILLSTAYFPSIEYMACLVKASHVFIEKYETYPKQSLRNRCYLASSQGIQTLSVPVVKPMGNHTPVDKILIDETQDFRTHHLKTIQTLYQSAPFFEYYLDDVRHAILFNETNLIKYNMNILEMLLKNIKLKKEMLFTMDFEKFMNDKIDLRNLISSKHSCNNYKVINNAPKYFQIFANKTGFFENLSILDLLFNEGPNTLNILRDMNINVE